MGFDLPTSFSDWVPDWVPFVGSKKDDDKNKKKKKAVKKRDPKKDELAGPLKSLGEPVKAEFPEQELKGEFVEVARELSIYSQSLVQSYSKPTVNWQDIVSPHVSPFLLQGEKIVPEKGCIHCDSVLIPHSERYIRDCFVIVTNMRVIIFQMLAITRPICQEPVGPFDHNPSNRDSARLVNERLLAYKDALDKALHMPVVLGASAESHFFYALPINQVRDVVYDLRSLAVTIQPRKSRYNGCCGWLFDCCLQCCRPKVKKASAPWRWTKSVISGLLTFIFLVAASAVTQQNNQAQSQTNSYQSHPDNSGAVAVLWILFLICLAAFCWYFSRAMLEELKDYLKGFDASGEILERTKKFIQDDQSNLLLQDEEFPDEDSEHHMLQWREKKDKFRQQVAAEAMEKLEDGDTASDDNTALFVTNSLLAQKRVLSLRYTMRSGSFTTRGTYKRDPSNVTSTEDNESVEEHELIVRLADDVAPAHSAFFMAAIQNQLPMYKNLVLNME